MEALPILTVVQCLGSCRKHCGQKYEVNEKNQIPLPTHPILIQTEDKNILIDTGIGVGKLTEKNVGTLVLNMKVI